MPTAQERPPVVQRIGIWVEKLAEHGCEAFTRTGWQVLLKIGLSGR